MEKLFALLLCCVCFFECFLVFVVLRDKKNKTTESKDYPCDGWKTSACCCTTLAYGYICNSCKEYSESLCEACPDKDTCAEITNETKKES